VGLSGCLGGIWEINFSLPPRGDASCQVPDGADGEACVRLVAAMGCQQFVEQRDGGVGADRRPSPQRFLPAGLERLDERVAHPVRDVGIEAASTSLVHRPHSMPLYSAWWPWLKSRGTPV